MMDDYQRSQLLEIRLKSKRGTRLTDGEMDFCVRMMKLDPMGYREAGTEVTRIVREEFQGT